MLNQTRTVVVSEVFGMTCDVTVPFSPTRIHLYSADQSPHQNSHLYTCTPVANQLRLYSTYTATTNHRRLYSSYSGRDNSDDEPSGAYWEQQYEERFGKSINSPLEKFIPNQQPSSLYNDSMISKSVHTSDTLTHTDSAGKANMVDVSHKTPTVRTSRAKATVILGPKAYKLVKHNQSKKGDVLSVARIAGIIGAKKTSELIPLCHNIPISKVAIDFSLNDNDFSVDVFSEASTYGVTGIEMEALTAVSTAALTVYDMCKAVSHNIIISDIKLLSKSGGKSDYTGGN